MIAVDTSAIVEFFKDGNKKVASLVEKFLVQKQLILPPVVVTELLSDPLIKGEIAEIILRLPALQIKTGFWQRAGRTRAILIGKRRKARLADSLIAQSCIDSQTPLLTCDSDFMAFAQFSDLKLVDFS